MRIYVYYAESRDDLQWGSAPNQLKGQRPASVRNYDGVERCFKTKYNGSTNEHTPLSWVFSVMKTDRALGKDIAMVYVLYEYFLRSDCGKIVFILKRLRLSCFCIINAGLSVLFFAYTQKNPLFSVYLPA